MRQLWSLWGRKAQRTVCHADQLAQIHQNFRRAKHQTLVCLMQVSKLQASGRNPVVAVRFVRNAS
jgi:hypothetical protein